VKTVLVPFVIYVHFCPFLSFFYFLSRLFLFITSVLSFPSTFLISVLPSSLFSIHLCIYFICTVVIHPLLAYCFTSVASLTGQQALMLAVSIFTQLSSLLALRCHAMFAFGVPCSNPGQNAERIGFYCLGMRTLQSVSICVNNKERTLHFCSAVEAICD
jgi:hypothetical protein